MANNSKRTKGGPNKQAARAAKQRREQRLIEVDPLFHGSPPYAGYRSWLIPNPMTGGFDLEPTAPMDSRLYFARVQELLLPLYRGRVPLAATYLDDRIKSGFIVLADDDEPDAQVSVVPVAVFAEYVGHGDGNDGRRSQEVCPQLNCGGAVHLADEHAVWIHLHHLHAGGHFLLNDRDAVRLTIPPHSPGEDWRFVSVGQGATPVG
ncbi:hypothetical protein [Wenjunlia tyrosinilytica]|uniref:Uncharacterized protein n=1 Tax=Wenjunlia tyrosinilytica TaxID=1544741 RepID=A0A918A1R1_9ACTN|nr:hypothetical protein [Wenjunlia tyrosinilytica]GGP01058.1 hypothetical protein GCM10012280_71140 [Wenjunlia tyrosinilytica]